MLRRWLRSLVIHIPDTSFSQAGIAVSLSEMACSEFGVEHIISSRISGSFAVDIAAKGFQASCTFGFSYKALGLPGAGRATASVGGGSSIVGPLELLMDNDPIAPLPKQIKTRDCAAKLEITKLDFSGSSFIDWVLKTLTSVIRATLPGLIAPLICSKLDGAISNLDLSNYTVPLRDRALAPPHPVEPLPRPHGDDVPDWADFRLMTSALGLVNGVIGNLSSKGNINAILSRLLKSADGNLTLWTSGKAPKPLHFSVPSLGDCNVSLPELSVAGLTSFRRIFMTAGPGPLNLGGGLALGQVSVAGRAQIRCQTVDVAQGPPLVEVFSISGSLANVEASCAGDVAIHQHNFNDAVLATPGKCLPSVLAGARAHTLLLNVTPATAAVRPAQGQDTLEQELDSLLNTVVAVGLEALGPSMSVLAYGYARGAARDALNTRLDAMPEVAACPPGPPPDAGAFYTLSAGSGVLALLLGIPALFLLMPSPRLLIRLLAKKEPPQRRLSLRANLEAGIAAELAAELAQGGAGNGRPMGGAPTLAEALAESPESTLPSCTEERQSSDTSSRGQAKRRISQVVSFLMGRPEWDCLASHEKVGAKAAIGMPLLLWSTFAMFACSNLGVGAEVWMRASINGETFVIQNLFDFTLINSVQDMWEAGSYMLAIIIAFFSGIWPYLKLIVMQVCWLMPVSTLSPRRRQALLEFLDAYGKWSLVDTFVLVIFMVSFHIVIDSDGPVLQSLIGDVGDIFSIEIMVSPRRSFHLFLAATVLSLVAGHVGVYFHRRAAVADGEEDPLVATTPCSALSFEERRVPMCQKVQTTSMSGTIFVTFVLVASLVLVSAGAGVNSFRFNFAGLTGAILGSVDSHRPFSLVSLGDMLPEAYADPDSITIRWIQAAYFLFSLAVVLAYHLALLGLWLWPMTRQKQRRLLVVAKTLNAWSGLDVFVLAIMASVFEISSLASFIVGHKCDAINALLANPPAVLATRLPKSLLEHPQCIELTTSLEPGCWLLFTSALVSGIVGQVMLGIMSNALGVTPGVPASTIGLSVMDVPPFPANEATPEVGPQPSRA